MAVSSGEPDPVSLPEPAVEVGGPAFMLGDEPAFVGGKPGIGLWVIEGGAPEEAGSLISQAVAEASAMTKAATSARTPRRRLSIHRGESAAAAWAGAC